MNKGKKIIAVAVALIMTLGAVYYLMLDGNINNVNVAGISTFQECADAGYPVMESYPERCATPDGREFINEENNNPVSNPPDASGSNPPASNPPANPGIPDGVVCTMDAMMCPDGTWVGRSGPNCEFICPGS